MSDDNIFEVNMQRHYRCYFCENEIEYSFTGNCWRHTRTGNVRCESLATPSNVEIPMTIDEIVATLPDDVD